MALELVVERGFGQVRVEEIAAETGVSPRTSSNYFSSKEEAVVSLLTARVQAFRGEIAAHASDEPLWDVISESVVALVPPEDGLDRWRQWVLLIRSTPSLEAEYLRADAALERELVTEIAARTGTDPRSDLFPRLAACAAVGAVRAALQFWLAGDGSASYRSLIQRARTYPMDAIADAHRSVETGHSRGKRVVRIAGA
ncbi:TetR family transcriptional regulator [Streptomyces sp. 184]|uniref:acyl-CoA-like ligand-binding transcription factor n=1 Tax=Streptomyces sp. 184 TaxID=1827526 RepID=UPI00389240EC